MTDHFPPGDERNASYGEIIPEQETIKDNRLKNGGETEFKEGVRLVLWVHAVIAVLLLFCGLPFVFQAGTEFLPILMMAAAFIIELLAVVQWLYVIPIIIVLLIRKNSDQVAGVLTVAGITFLAGGAAFGLCAAIMTLGPQAFR